MDGAQNTGTVQNRALRVGTQIVQEHLVETVQHPVVQAAGPVVVGLDGGYVRSRHRRDERIHPASIAWRV